MPRPTTTILMLLDDRWARGDVDRAGSIDVRCGDAPAATPCESLQAAIDAGGRTAKRVWVLTDRAWLGDVDLPASATVGLTNAQLADAAAYEAEAIGGLAQWDAVTAARRVRVRDAHDRFLTVQIARTELGELATVLSKHGATLAGLLHPAGLPLDVCEQENPEHTKCWCRIEFWRDDTVVVHAARDRTEVHPTGVAPAADWRRAVRAVVQAAGMDAAAAASPAILIGPGTKPADGPRLDTDPHDAAPRWADSETHAANAPAHRVLNLASDDAVRRFVEAWARVILKGHPDLLVLRKPKTPAGPLPQILVGLVAFALAAALVYFQHSTAEAKLDALRAAATRVQAEQAELVQLRRNTQDLTREIRTKTHELERQRAASDADARRAHTPKTTPGDMRPRLASLLHTLTDADDAHALQGGFVIKAIRPQSPTHQIEGVATSSLAATGLARHLADALEGLWHVHPAEVTPVTQGESVVWRFTLLVEPVRGVPIAEAGPPEAGPKVQR